MTVSEYSIRSYKTLYQVHTLPLGFRPGPGHSKQRTIRSSIESAHPATCATINAPLRLLS
eukprot:SAG22_NODE_19693_length_272_cov_0.901734_1_plen_59_part_10